MQDFNAEDAKQITKNAILSQTSIMYVLSEIKKEAEKGKSYLDTKRPLSEFERTELVKRGFNVGRYEDNIILQTIGMYDKISW